MVAAWRTSAAAICWRAAGTHGRYHSTTNYPENNAADYFVPPYDDLADNVVGQQHHREAHAPFFYTIVVVETLMISSCNGDCVGIIISAMMTVLQTHPVVASGGGPLWWPEWEWLPLPPPPSAATHFFILPCCNCGLLFGFFSLLSVSTIIRVVNMTMLQQGVALSK